MWAGAENHHYPTGLSLNITKARVPFGLNLCEGGAFNMRDGSIQYTQLYYSCVSLKKQTKRLQYKPGDSRKLRVKAVF